MSSLAGAFIGATSELNEINYRNSDCMFDFRERIEELKKQFDFIIADSAPSYSNVMIAAHMSADFLLIPTLLEKQARNAVGKQLTYMQKIKRNYNPSLQFMGTYVTQTQVKNYKKPLKEGYLGPIDTLNLNLLIEILQGKATLKNTFSPIYHLYLLLQKKRSNLGSPLMNMTPSVFLQFSIKNLPGKLFCSQEVSNGQETVYETTPGAAGNEKMHLLFLILSRSLQINSQMSRTMI